MMHPDPYEPKTVVVAGVSGGKDSTALSLWLTEQGIEHRRVFADTGWEHPATTEYVTDYLPGVLGPIDTVRSEHTFESLVIAKGMFPGRTARFCTQVLKMEPISAYLRETECDVNAIGIRALESNARAKAVEWEWTEKLDCHTWRPLLRWTVDDVIAMHRRHDVRPNPLYLRGARRVGCWPCIHARKEELRLLAGDPERVERVRQLEAAVQEAARARYAEKGETFESLGYTPPTLFTLRKKGSVRHHKAPIDQVLKWAQTSHGGDQLLLLDPGERDGCMRWGMCDTVPEDE